MCDKVVCKVLELVPSPKSQNRLVIVPVELSVKLTVSGLRPVVGVPAKAATGTNAPMPVTALVLLPALLLENTTALLKNPALLGVNCTVIFVDPKPGRLNAVGETMEKGPLVTLIVPLSKGPPPRLVRVKAAETVCPTATVPKSMLEGATAS